MSERSSWPQHGGVASTPTMDARGFAKNRSVLPPGIFRAADSAPIIRGTSNNAARVGSRPRAIPSQTEPPPGTSAERDRHCPPDMAAEFISPFVEPVPMAAVPQHLLPSLFGLPAHAMPASSSCVYYSDNASLPEKAANATRFVCISDTHTHTDQVRSADFRLFFSCENDFALAQGPAGRRADPRRRLHLHGCNR